MRRRSAERRIRGVDYHINEWGDAGSPLLVLLHGWGDTGSSYQFLVDELESQWFVVAPDWRGFGESRCRAEAYWFPDYLADLDEMLAIYSPRDAVRLVGHSMGANIAGLYAGIFPERVAAFVNVEGFGLEESDPRNAPDHYRRWIERSRDEQAYASYQDFAELARRILKRNPRMSAEKALFVAGLWGEQLADGSVVLRADPAHRLPNAVQYRRAEAHACWEKISAPVLVVKGAESDFYARAKQHAGPQEIEVFDAAESVEIDAAGHMLHFEQPAALAEAIEGFLKRV
ncbi:MAG: alpha/beta hydrolase [Woeseiaceae bacterium]|nr:alpha/beta hydrolase [Woeseiaceae bacterium]